MASIQNPILRGFNPDPSILRVGEDFYIATSTFEWFPGVQIHHSKDLENWHVVSRPLDRVSQLDMKGDPDSGGVWAPCLSYHNGLFHLMYTDVKANAIIGGGLMHIMHNYLVTAPSIEGPWSEPVHLFSGGYDPSLFEDDDGRTWVAWANFDYRKMFALHNRKTSIPELIKILRRDGFKGTDPFTGIYIQEFSHAEQRLIGERRLLHTGTGRGVPEGPHIIRRNGYYYLLIAEGGSAYDHCVSLLRAKELFGPYEINPYNPLMTSKTAPDHPLQKAGHADYVETPAGESYIVHLCSRPLNGKHSILGRETALQKVYWTEDGWLRLQGDEQQPSLEVESPGLPAHPWPKLPVRDDFDGENLGIQYHTLRIPLDERSLSLRERPGFLRLYGAEGLNSLFHQAMVARRQEHFCYRASTSIDFEPVDYNQAAGLVAWYDTDNFHYCHITQDEDRGKVLEILSASFGVYKRALNTPIRLRSGPVELRMEMRDTRLQFFYRQGEDAWQKVGKSCDTRNLTDENHYPYPSKILSSLAKPLGADAVGFTGSFIGLCCQDIGGRRPIADFDFLEYAPLDDEH